jgi:hypothetical protein
MVPIPVIVAEISTEKVTSTRQLVPSPLHTLQSSYSPTQSSTSSQTPSASTSAQASSPIQTPATQTSLSVVAFPSSQAVPSEREELKHAPSVSKHLLNNHH